jgi:DtxR family Mn-dependent transcriptional regulator
MTESEEMYLITIARLEEDGLEGPAPLSKLADLLEVAPVSVNQMVKKLELACMVEYIPYKGVALTLAGRRLALHVLRLRRLWEFFLVNNLHLPLPDADALACRMEHITSSEVADRLADFLGNPAFSAQGKPIPTGDGEITPVPDQTLVDLLVGDQGEVLQVADQAATADFLKTEGMQPGSEVTVLAIGGDGARLIQVDNRRISLTATVAAQIVVQKKEVGNGSSSNSRPR